MKKFNVSIVFSVDKSEVLMCKRAKQPYKNLYNFIGGKLDAGEDDLAGAYRELLEETGVTDKDIILEHLMTFSYPFKNIELQVYFGFLNKHVDLVEEVNKLYWVNRNSDFSDMSIFAGEGNIGHMMEQINLLEK